MTYKIIDKTTNKEVYQTHSYDDAMAYLSQDYDNLVFIKD